jgi:2'-5' RNA ligase
MGTQRLFIAIELSPQIIQALEQTILSYQRSKLQGVRWVPAKNIHLTLHFLGDTTHQQYEMISLSLPSEIVKLNPFELTVEGSGAFPNTRAPRVIWVGVKAPSELSRLQLTVENCCRQAGFAPETRPFNPHLTLGRVSGGGAQVGQALNANQVGLLGRCTVDQVTLFKSDLTPGGSIYTPLAHFPLK